MKELIQRVLDHCGYEGEPSEDNLKHCFLDYVDSGIFGNLTSEEAEKDIESGDITLKMMCYNLLKT
jgi:hypothetical protein